MPSGRRKLTFNVDWKHFNFLILVYKTLAYPYTCLKLHIDCSLYTHRRNYPHSSRCLSFYPPLCMCIFHCAEGSHPLLLDCPDLWPAKNSVNISGLGDGIEPAYTLHNRNMTCSITLEKEDEVCLAL